ncbi:hypothetical protein EN45_025700 [Penicillium chrysogenum]|uniref:Uncharacterized protein n=1 Tax=Penicillium chrysogenum TaxID=5076 RepID=A0A167X4S8_PENCH|nr:hypothetical protein EN45_025700 [Penicillium chrysogenum]
MGMTTRSQRVGLNPQLPEPPARRPSPILEAANPAISPEYPNVEDFSLAEDDSHDEDYFLVSITYDYSTITARARSFQGIVLAGATPLQLAQNGFYYRPSGYTNYRRLQYKDSNSIHADYIYYSEGTVEHQPGLPFQSATRHNRPRASTTSNIQQPTLPSLIKRYRPSLSRPKTNKQRMLPSSSDLSHLYRNRLLQCKNLFFPPTPYSQLKIFIFVFTINRHRSISRIRQANAQSNEL